MKMNKIITVILTLLLIALPFNAAAQEHTHEMTEEYAAPSCDKEGYYFKYCTICGYSEEGKIILPKTEHSYGEWIKDVPPSCIGTGSEVRYCQKCRYRDFKIVPATGVHNVYVFHNYPATEYSAGEYVEQCRVCNIITKKLIFPRLKSVALSKGRYTYDGKKHKPKIKALDADNNRISKSNYSYVMPSKTKKVGNYTVKVKFKNNYYGEYALSYSIIPRKAYIKKIRLSNGSVLLKLGRKKKEADGFIVEYSAKKSFKHSKTVVVKDDNKLLINSLKADKKYYFRVCAFSEVNGNKICSKWSKTKTAEIK